MLRYMIILAMSVSACSESPGGWPMDVNPTGPYSTSCSECVTQGRVVTCASCVDGLGGSVEAVLAFEGCQAAVVNCGGVLQCDLCAEDRLPAECTTDSDCADQCVDCYQCLLGRCVCGYREYPVTCRI